MSIVKPSTDGKFFVEYGKHIKYYIRNKPELKELIPNGRQADSGHWLRPFCYGGF